MTLPSKTTMSSHQHVDLDSVRSVYHHVTGLDQRESVFLVSRPNIKHCAGLIYGRFWYQGYTSEFQHFAPGILFI